MDLRISDHEIRIVSLTAHSGPGQLTATGRLLLDRWRLVSLEAAIDGEKFRMVNLPELQLLVSPRLTVKGTPEVLQVRGAIAVPELLLIDEQQETPVGVSEDVVIVDAPPEEEKKRALPLALDIEVQLLLGDRVLVKRAGIDARLGGSLDLAVKGGGEMTGRGEIEVEEGSYSAFGVNLTIEEGKLIYAGGPISQPTLDIRAARKVGEIEAGAQVSGTPASPVVDLYSRPAMTHTDILSYIVFGRPFGTETAAEANLLMTAAGSLLSRGESAMLQDQLKQRLGLDILEVQSGGGDLSSSMVTVGKYLSPGLFVSFGQSLFTSAQELRLRYTFRQHWEIESRVGEESGVDLFYKIEFR